MLHKTLTAIAATGMIALGSLAAAPASATESQPHATSFAFSVGGHDWRFSFGKPFHHPQKVCEPIYQRVFWRSHGKLQSRVVKVGETCRWVYPQVRRPVYPVWPRAW